MSKTVALGLAGEIKKLPIEITKIVRVVPILLPRTDISTAFCELMANNI